MKRSLMYILIVLFITTGCASVKLKSSREGERYMEESKWQTGIIGAFQDDILVKHKDGSCVRITWNKAVQLLLPIVITEVYDEKPCNR